MRDQMMLTLEDLFAQDKRLFLVLAEIGRDQASGLFVAYPERTLNVGISEQTMIGVGAGLALEGFIPVLHSITPFLVERPFEQIKDDFCYQRLGGNLVSTGASYDYGTDGMTHYGVGDVQVLRSLPGMQITVPGTASEFDQLFKAAYANGVPTYYRLNTATNAQTGSVQFGRMDVVKRGQRATIIAVGPMLDRTLAAVADMDVSVLYCTTVAPFDVATLCAIASSGDVIVVEPYYEGVLVPDIMQALSHRPVRVEAIGVPHQVISRYGTTEQHDEALGLTSPAIRQRIERFLSC
jgi:transketolase